MKARFFQSTVVFLLTFVFSTLSVYAQDEDILIEPPLTWSINSIQIVWDVTQGATKTQEAKFIYGADLINSETFGKDQTETKEKSFGLSGAGGARLDGSIGLDTNPLNSFGLFGAKVNASAYVEGGFNYNQTDRTTDTTQWSDSEKSVVSQALTSAFQQSEQQTISNQSLVFTVDFVNHTSTRLFFNPNSANTIPVFCGNIQIGDAYLINQKATIAATGKPISCRFKMELDDTGKQSLLNNRPSIRFDGGQLLIQSNPNDGKPFIKDAIQESTVTTNYFTIAILYGNEVKEWKIRYIKENSVTLQEALEAINESIRTKNNTSKSVFKIKDNHFVSVCKAPFSNKNNSEWLSELKIYKDEDEQTENISNPDSCLSDIPQLGDRYIFQLVSQEIQELEAKAKAGNADAICILACKYYSGDGVPQDIIKAVKWCRKAAEKNHSIAQYILGLSYYYGEGVEEDKTEAINWCRKAAEQGYAEAQLFLGDSYYEGDGIDQDREKAVVWYLKAAKQGNVDAQYYLGGCYYDGTGISQDHTKAVQWWRKAAEQGLPAAQFWLGYCYMNGKGVPEDKEEAVKWYRKAAEQGLADAQNELGICYYNGFGVLKDCSKAVDWYSKAADQGYAKAQYNLALRYNNGEGVPINYKKAAELYYQAAIQGITDAQYNLGNCYCKGKGVDENKTEAIKWWSMAAQGGSAIAQTQLGKCYVRGDGVQVDLDEAKKWLRRAANQGHKSAIEALNKLNESY